MDIAIIGTGNVGSALGRGWAKKKHTVVFGSREANAAKVPPGCSAASVRDAVARSQVVVLAVPWPAARAVISEAGPLAGKILIDCINPLKSDLSGLEIGHTSSAAEQIASWATHASVFKAFNQTGANNMASTTGYQVPPVMFVCGNDQSKKPQVLELVKELGFDAIDAGDLSVARLLEPLAMLWIHLAIHRKFGVDFAFALERRK